MSKLQILAPISLGELIDKLTILNIKLDRVQDPEKRHNIKVEHDELSNILNGLDIYTNPRIIKFEDELYDVNENIFYL